MKRIAKCIVCVLLIAILATCTLAGCAGKQGDTPQTLTIGIKSINKYGNVQLDTDFAALNAAGIDVGDILTVYVGDNEYTIPAGNNFSDVDSGNMVFRFDLEDTQVVLGINMGSFAATTGIGEKVIVNEEPGFRWDMAITEVRIVLKEKGGYLDEFNARNLVRTNVRADYANLSDAEYANFREVTVTGIQDNVLYRTSSPLDPSIARNQEAMAAMEAAGIRTVINMTDSESTMQAYVTYADSYYSTCNIFNAEMSYDFASEEFGRKIKLCIDFIIQNEGPYMLHCKEGKDRTGILCAILECFVGTTYDEMIEDYMETYYNFFHVTPQDTTYARILDNNIVKTLCTLYEVDNLAECDLQAECIEYLTSIGMTNTDIADLESKIKQ